jgi:hypothetical protein
VSENLKLVRLLYADWERDDYTGSEWAHPDIEWAIVEGPDLGIWRGVAGMADGFRSSSWLAQGKRSGMTVEVRSADAYAVENEKIRRSWGGYPDVQAALKAVGLRD